MNSKTIVFIGCAKPFEDSQFILNLSVSRLSGMVCSPKHF